MSQQSNNGHTSPPKYPLGASTPDLMAISGRPLHTIDIDAATRGELSAADLQIGPDTLRVQADIAFESGYVELAQNLRRAAELTAVPNEELLRMYELLRPHRATYEELLALSETLVANYQAPLTAHFIREAAAVYQTRNLLRK